MKNTATLRSEGNWRAHCKYKWPLLHCIQSSKPLLLQIIFLNFFFQFHNRLVHNENCREHKSFQKSISFVCCSQLAVSTADSNILSLHLHTPKWEKVHVLLHTDPKFTLKLFVIKAAHMDESWAPSEPFHSRIWYKLTPLDSPSDCRFWP